MAVVEVTSRDTTTVYLGGVSLADYLQPTVSQPTSATSIHDQELATMCRLLLSKISIEQSFWGAANDAPLEYWLLRWNGAGLKDVHRARVWLVVANLPRLLPDAGDFHKCSMRIVCTKLSSIHPGFHHTEPLSLSSIISC